ncbi:MAG: PAS domain-containing protein [Deltaproteobacteria bacterium]|nr:PAS domain-containing protein [Deltaproteobacteria bacterium]
MREGGRDIDDVLDAILRGAAKILGCGSTNLILFNEKTEQVRIRVGAMATSYPMLDEIERLLGERFSTVTLPLRSAQGSLVYASWRDGVIRETSSLRELVGTAFAPELTAELGRVIGEHRFICVPARSGTCNYGVLLFEKQGPHPFSRQQRTVLLRYARGIGEILESHLVAHGQTILAQPADHGPAYVLFDAAGTPRLFGPDEGGAVRRLLADPSVLARLGERIRALLANHAFRAGGGAQRTEDLDAERCLDLVPLAADGEAGVLGVLRQRHGQRRASLESQLMQLTLGDPAPALFVDPAFRVTSCNEAAEQLFGYPGAELRSAPVGRLFRHEREILDILSPQILDPVRPYFEESAVVRRQDGSLRPARAQALLLADDVDRVEGYLIVVRPRAAEGERTADAQQRLATLGEMAAQLAHEIRNPLVAIGAALDSLGREGLSAEQQGIVTSAAREIERLDAVVQGYLAVRPDLSHSRVRVAEVVEGACRLLATARQTDGKRVVQDIDPGLTVWADYDALRRALLNLLLNALEASPAGGRVVCRAAQDAHDVSILVEDDGPGLRAPSEQCFQPFFTTKKHGTGLGLPVCRTIARAHGGLVELRSRPEGGAQAELVLPRRAPRDPGSNG